MNTKLYVGNLPWSATDDQLTEFFERSGIVIKASVILNRETGKSRGFGFVEMATEDEMKNAVEMLNNSIFDGREIIVREAIPEKRATDFINRLKKFMSNSSPGESLNFSTVRGKFLVQMLE